MKKRVLSAIFSALLLTGCTANPADSRADHTPPEIGEAEGSVQTPPMSETPDGVTAAAEQLVYPPDVSEIRLHVRTNTDTALTLPQKFTLTYFYPREKDFASSELPYKDNGDSFTELAQEIPARSESDVILDIAAHYDLPLEAGFSGFYRAEIGSVTADFQISADSIQYDSQTQVSVQLEAEHDTYSAGSETIAVRIINLDSKDLIFDLSHFSIEHFTDGAVSMTPYAGTEAGKSFKLVPEDCMMLTLSVADFSGMKLESGEYAVCFAGQEAGFKVT